MERKTKKKVQTWFKCETYSSQVRNVIKCDISDLVLVLELRDIFSPTTVLYIFFHSFIQIIPSLQNWRHLKLDPSCSIQNHKALFTRDRVNCLIKPQWQNKNHFMHKWMARGWENIAAHNEGLKLTHTRYRKVKCIHLFPIIFAMVFFFLLIFRWLIASCVNEA